jgi:adenine-specific DNA-methyltransferase
MTFLTTIQAGKPMPTLHWIGKDKVINHHLDVPYKVLEHKYGFNNGTQGKTDTGSGNNLVLVELII